MTYYDTLDKNIWDSLGNSFDKFHPYALDNEDIRRSTIIADEITTNYVARNLNGNRTIDFKSLLQGTIMRFCDLGLFDVAKTAFSILNNTRYFRNDSFNDFSFTVQSVIVQSGALVSKRCHHIEVPQAMSTLSVHFMLHETSHILKEMNPYECRGVYTDNEVIPILLELISAYEEKDFDVFKKRELLLLDVADLFRKLCKDRNSISEKDFVGFNACYRQCILYLNSFYYSLKLFAMYLDDSDLVIAIINDVLNHTMTTSEVIKLYLNNDSSLYDEGLREFRSKLK